MVGDDGSDILGGDKLPVGRYQPPSYWSTLSGLAKLSLYSVTFLLSALFLRTFYHRFLRWRETNYRKCVPYPKIHRVSSSLTSPLPLSGQPAGDMASLIPIIDPSMSHTLLPSPLAKRTKPEKISNSANVLSKTLPLHHHPRAGHSA